jgi:hypothetical protein
VFLVVTRYVDNVMFNGPRAGICFNDGYGGGDLVEGNLVFNMVRETGDHGSFNRYFEIRMLDFLL